MVRARSLAALAAAAAVPALAHGSAVAPSFSTPSFDCSTGGTLASINWGDMEIDNTIIIVSTPGAANPGPINFGCSDGVASSFISGGDEFSINWGDFSDSSDKWGSTAAKIERKDVDEADTGFKISDFDVYLPAVQDTANVVDFLGIQFKYKDGERDPGPTQFSVDDQGELIMDPGIPPSGVTVTLYSSPQAVPEPDAMLLLGTGLAGAATALRRKKKR